MQTRKPGLAWVERLSAFLFGGSSRRGEGSGSVQPQSPLRARLEDTTAETIVGGAVELLGMAEIRERLGQDWELVAPIVDEIATAELDGRLGPGDVYERTDDGYLVCFEDSSVDAARRAAADIAQSVERRLVEQAAIAGVRGRSRVAQLPLSRLRQGADPLAAMQLELAAGAESDARPATIRLQPGILFQPVWPRSRLGQTQNRCVMDSISGVAVARQIEELASHEDLQDALAGLDASLLEGALTGLRDALSTVRSATILVPVHFHSLLGGGSVELVSIGSTMPRQYRQSVLLDVIGIPESATTGDLLEAVRMAREIADRIVLQLHPADGRFRKALVELVWGASLNLSDMSETGDEAEIRLFAVHAAEVGLRSYAYGANTLGKAMTAVKADFDFVAGAAVHHIVASPRARARFIPLFGDPPDGARKLERVGEKRLHSRFVPADPHSVLTFPDGTRAPCLVDDVSASGARLVTQLRPDLGSAVMLGTLHGRVVRHVEDGVAVRFLELHQPAVIEEALKGTDLARPQVPIRAIG